MVFQTILILGLTVGALCAPMTTSGGQRCAEKCTSYDKMNIRFNSSMTYTYKLEGSSSVSAITKSNSQQKIQWQAHVQITALNNCDVQIEIQNPKIQSSEGSISADSLSEWPMVVGMESGVITDVCAHPRDSQESLNWKKAIISSMQNVLPKFSDVANGKTFDEVDVLGRCPSYYKITKQGSTTQVEKTRIKKDCIRQESQPLSSMILSTLLGATTSIGEKSPSICTQTIENSILTKVMCNERQSIDLPVKQSLQTNQESSMQLQKVGRASSTDMKFNPRRTSIVFERYPHTKSKQYEASVIREFKETCSLIGSKDEQIPAKMASIISLLRRTPNDFAIKLMQQARNKQLCHKNIETLTQSAILSTYTPAAVRFITHELKNNRISSIAASFYGISLQFSGEANQEMLEEILPIIQDHDMPKSLKLAAGTVVQRYCKSDSRCKNRSIVRDIEKELSKQVSSSCSRTKNSDYEQTTKALTSIKTLSNIGSFGKTATQTMVDCLMLNGVDTGVRVAAAEGLRRSHLSSKQIQSLVSEVTKRHTNSEVRIAAYLATIPRISVFQAQRILDAIIREPNTQVRSFILSHLRNVQQTRSSNLQNLRYRLARLSIPQDMPYNMKQHSTNMDLSMYLPNYRSGAAIDSNVIYDSSSSIPRQFSSNFSVNAFGRMMNIGEIGVRLEDVTSFFRYLLGPEKFELTMNFYEALVNALNAKQASEVKSEDSTLNMADRLRDILTANESGQSTIQAFIRVLGQEFNFVSAKGDLSSFYDKNNISELMQRMMASVREAMSGSKQNYILQQFSSEVYIPTLQGAPLQIKSATTLLTNPQIQAQMSKSVSTMEMSPRLHASSKSFIGYTLSAKTGLQFNVTSQLKFTATATLKVDRSSASLTFDIPQNQTIIKSKSCLYLTTRMPGKAEVVSGRLSAKKNSTSKLAEDWSRLLGMQLSLRQSQSQMESLMELSMSKLKEAELMNVILRNHSSVRSASYQFSMHTPSADRKDRASLMVTNDEFESGSLMRFDMKGMTNESQRVLELKSSYTNTNSAIRSSFAVFWSKKAQINGATDKIFESQSEISSDVGSPLFFSAKTSNDLKKYMEMDILASGDRSPSSTIRLKKMRVDLGMGGYRTRNFMENSNDYERLEISSNTSHNGNTLSKMDITLACKGNFGARNSKAEIAVAYDTRSSGFYMESTIVRENGQSVGKVELIDNKKKLMAKLEAFIKPASKGSQDIRATFVIPEYVRQYTIEGTTKEISASTYNLDMTMKREKEPLVHIDGPILFDYQAMQFVEKSNFTVSVRKLKYKLNSFVSWQRDSAEWQVEAENQTQATRIEFNGVSNPNEFRTLLNFEGKKSPIEWYSKIVINPSTKVFTLNTKYGQNGRRIKGTSRILSSQNQIKGNIALDADRNPKDIYNYDLHYDVDSSSKTALIRGNVDVPKRGQYHIEATTKIEYLLRKAQQQNNVNIRLVTPKKEEFVSAASFESRTNGNGSQQQMSVYVHSLSKKVYKMNASQREEGNDSLTKRQRKFTIQIPSFSGSLENEMQGDVQSSVFSLDASRSSKTELKFQSKDKKIDFDGTVEQKEGFIQTRGNFKAGEYRMSISGSPKRFTAELFDQNKPIVQVVADTSNRRKWSIHVKGPSSKALEQVSSQLLSQLNSGEITCKGVLQMDIFAQSKSVIVEVASAKQSNDHVKSILRLRTPSSEKAFWIIMDSSMNSQEVQVSIKLTKNPSSPPLVQIGTYNKRTTNKNSNTQISFKSSSEQLELITSTRDHSGIDCMGYIVNGTLSSRTSGKQDVQLLACSPSYVQFGLKESSKQIWNVVKIGMKSYSTIVVALEDIYQSPPKNRSQWQNYSNTFNLVDQTWTIKKTLAMVGMRVRNPRLLSVSARYDRKQLQTFANSEMPSTSKQIENISRSVASSIRSAFNEVIPKSVQYAPSIKKLENAVRTRAHSLYARVSKDMQASINATQAFINKYHDKLLEDANRLYEYANHIFKSISNKSLSETWQLIPSWNQIGTKVNTAVTRFVRETIDEITKSISGGNGFWSIIKEFLIEHREQIINAIEDFNTNVVPTVLHIFTDPIVNAIENWLMNLKLVFLQPFFGPIVPRDMGVLLNKDVAALSIAIPLKSDVASVEAALSNIGFQRPSICMPRDKHAHQFHSHSESVARYLDDEIITFDGMVVPKHKTMCELELCSGMGARLTVKELNDKSRKVIFSVNEREVELWCTNGQAVKIVRPRRGKLNSKEIQMKRLSEKSVEMSTDAMTVWVTDRTISVEAKPISFNKLRGLMGTNDNEISTDFSSTSRSLYKPESSLSVHHVSSKVARKMFQQSRVDESCKA